MIRLIGALLVVAACVWGGQRGAKILDEHRSRLHGAEQGIIALMKEIEYLATPLPEALQRVALLAGRAGPLYDHAASALRSGGGLSGSDAWQQALAKERDIWNEAEYTALLTVSAGLGETDSAAQLRRLELARLRVAECESNAADRADKFGRIWRSMGWAVGAVLVLLML